MPNSSKQEIVIVRRNDDGEDVVKGGAWKIAHADFMTAMMAFFLVMWLIGMTDEKTRSGVANYFNPVQLAESTPNKKGLDDPQDVPPDNETDNTKDGKQKGSGEGTGGKSHQLRKPRFKEGALFQDPYAVLARIAEEADVTPYDTLGADATPGDTEVPGLKAGEAFRDPFDPLYWQVAPVDKLKMDPAPKPGTAAPAPSKAIMDVVAALSQKSPAAGNPDTKAPASAPVSNGTPPDAVAQPASNDPSAANAVDLKAAELKRDIMKAVQPAKDTSPQPRIDVRRTGAGTLISLTDDFDFTMFAVGSAEPHAKVVRAMAEIAKILQSRPGKIVIRGHTDARPFKSANYDNWRLSQARAQMALYMLVRGGLNEGRIVRVEGHADRDPKIPSDPNADQNRRVEILLQE
ncbi:MotB family protein [Microvirga lotononidis]|uniref:Flagellar motor protein n=1 Tax=Microvirga lotononidis TaxID=864069 RepID=I4YLT7_9HYPH|nr:MotB family protein [Microvirga lotononidis]EIM24929.1 flagellar motor protein [Microvirga lotononidis]WQO29570.1 MotB family protein [Microvirga lotononidis]